jgi:hypothetical protein
LFSHKPGKTLVNRTQMDRMTRATVMNMIGLTAGT